MRFASSSVSKERDISRVDSDERIENRSCCGVEGLGYEAETIQTGSVNQVREWMCRNGKVLKCAIQNVVRVFDHSYWSLTGG
jgi:hypothetical protein